jgi:IS5 family transposase
MRPKQQETTRSGDLFRATLEQIINMKHELVQLAGKLDWEWIDDEIGQLYSDQGRPGIATRFRVSDWHNALPFCANWKSRRLGRWKK